METIGGQAVIEGVMMRDGHHYAIAVRTPGQKIITSTARIPGRPGLFKLPFFRGMYALVETLIIGITALRYAARHALPEEEQEHTSPFGFAVTLIISFAAALAIFKLIPLGITSLVAATGILTQGVLFNLIEGMLKGGIFVLYIAMISLSRDVQRLFQYHGAEHMSIHCAEAGKALSEKNISGYSPIHPRCGTSFIAYVILVSIIVYSFIPGSGFWKLSAWRILLLPAIAGISYELLKLSGKHRHTLVLRALALPGMWIQRMTTAAPDRKQIQVAATALRTLRNAPLGKSSGY
ncbi:DUF1385 domain-containing protein [Candidatus Woesearchaeota archaeon]|nr:DUF1385 domain-containing protein [Candidatus Woesearchaeota archaeon]